MFIVYSYYVLDIIHEGHILQMKNAKALAGVSGISIVGILTNEAVMEKKKKPILSLKSRMTIADSIKYNDIVIPQYIYSPLDNLNNIKPNIALESTSHKEEDIEKVRTYMKKIKGIVIVMPYFPETSSTSIKEKIIKCQSNEKDQH